MTKKKICFVVAVPSTAQSFLRDHFEAMSKEYDIYLAGNITDPHQVENLNIKGYHPVDIQRAIAIQRDLAAVKDLCRYFRKMKFDAVHSVTPKAGLVCALAAKMAGIPIRIHIFTGQVWATKTGSYRWMLKKIDWLIAKLNNHILVDGKSQLQFLIDNKVVNAAKAKVLGHGSICGVNVERFSPSPQTKTEVRKELWIRSDKVVFVFMGRLNHDKGIEELLTAFNRLASENKDVYLLIYGNDEEQMSETFSQYRHIRDGVNFTYFGVTDNPGRMLQGGDVFVLPTYREGFGSSVIEAQCLGLPVITSDAYGVVDASIPNVTGLRCGVKNPKSLFEAMRTLADDEKLRKEMGQKGRERVLRDFSNTKLTSLWIEYYRNLLS